MFYVISKLETNWNAKKDKTRLYLSTPKNIGIIYQWSSNRENAIKYSKVQVDIVAEQIKKKLRYKIKIEKYA